MNGTTMHRLMTTWLKDVLMNKTKVLSVLFNTPTTESEVIEVLELLIDPVVYLEFVLPEGLDESWIVRA